MFLHGYGERGDDPKLLTAQPLPETLAHTTSFPAVVFSPQLPLQFNGWSEMIAPVDALLQRLTERYPIDTHRLYLTGLSTGGYGTWTYALRHPKRFAALVPIAGGYEQGGIPPNICALRNTPIWAFHGALDTIITPYHSEVLVNALRACGSSVVRFTLYPGVDHFHSWTRAYADPGLWRWLFAQHLKQARAPIPATASRGRVRPRVLGRRPAGHKGRLAPRRATAGHRRPRGRVRAEAAS